MSLRDVALLLAARPTALAEKQAIDTLCSILGEDMRPFLVSASAKDLDAVIVACEKALAPAPAPVELDDESGPIWQEEP